MRPLVLCALLASSLLLQSNQVAAFATSSSRTPSSASAVKAATRTSNNIAIRLPSSSSSTSLSASTTSSAVTPSDKKTEKRALVRKEGGLFAFNTKYGALNPYAIYYGLVAIFLGIPWFLALKTYELFTFLTRGKFDKQRRIPVTITHVWGTLLMRLTRQYPKILNRDILMKFYKEKRPAMFVANHSSWQDIPFLGVSIGWRNYKLISKKELYKVPILGTAIKVGGNIMVDRSNRKSQLKTLREGIQYLKDGVHLCTYPEGTRSRTGKLMPFKHGAFKMAHKAEAPVIPVSIVGADKVHPSHWMFPYRPATNIAKVVLHEPIESKGKTEEELAEEVRASMISGLDEYQLPNGE